MNTAPPDVREAALKAAPPYIAAAITKLGFTPEEAILLNAEFAARWNNTSQTILYLDDLPAGEREQFEKTARNGFSEPLFRFWYQFSKSDFSPEAVGYIDNLLAQWG